MGSNFRNPAAPGNVYKPAHVPKHIIQALTAFLAQKTITDINRDSYVPCVLEDKANNVQFCFQFSRFFKEVVMYEDVDKSGFTAEIPGYWICTPYPLADNYLLHLIADYYLENITGGLGGSGNGNNNGCPCVPPTTCPPAQTTIIKSNTI